MRMMKNIVVKWFSFVLTGVMCVTMAKGMLVVDAAKTDVPEKKQTITKQQTSIEHDNEMSVRGATIWPIQVLSVTDEVGMELCTVEAGTPLVALAQANGLFKIYYNNRVGYISSDCCMVNLPDVLQEEMVYDITNSYSSIYKIHGKAIEAVTGEVLYPEVMLEDDTYLVPLLFPVAQRLFEAEEDAIERGFTLKIYDAYRPYEVSKYIYATMMEFLDDNPEYLEMMTEPVKGKSFGPSAFLNKGISFHNYGVAVDITIVDLETGEELETQAPMHELSTRSIHLLDNENAYLLKEIMVAHGFTTISSEWWHYEIRDYVQGYGAFQATPIK